MRKLILIASAAPLALLAACGETAEDTTDVAVTDDMTATQPADPDEGGEATAIAEAGDYSGTYSFTAADGTKRSVSLDSSNNSYRYTGEDGTERTGTYTIADDGYRLSFADYYGGPAYFAYRNGAFYRLPENITVDTPIVASGERYARDDDAPFTREPEIGSPVAPTDLSD